VAEILAALGLCVCDLFEGPPPAPEQAIALMAAREARDRAARAEREAWRNAWDRVRRWEAIVEQIGAKLVLEPENDALGKVFDQACYRLHDSEIAEFEVRP
jgi:sugar phosphate isomerase/epimerase